MLLSALCLVGWVQRQLQCAVLIGILQANKLEFSNKRVSGFDPNTFHLESIVLNKDGSFEHRYNTSPVSAPLQWQ